MTASTAAKSAAAKAAKANEVTDGVADAVTATKAHVQSASLRVRKFPRSTQEAYEGQHDRPLGGYLVAAAAYTGLTAAAAGIGRLRGSRVPARIDGRDVLLLGIATHRLSRMIAKDPILSPLRAPFTTYKGTSGEAELAEEVRGTGVQHAFGELITCPFCTAQWVATAMAAGLVIAPRWTRLVASVFAMKAISDVSQFVYDGIQKSVQTIPAPEPSGD
jgi:hypothetical protein